MNHTSSSDKKHGISGAVRKIYRFWIQKKIFGEEMNKLLIDFLNDSDDIETIIDITYLKNEQKLFQS